MGFAVRKGSEKGVSRRCLERALGEYAPLGVHPYGETIFVSRLLDVSKGPLP